MTAGAQAVKHELLHCVQLAKTCRELERSLASLESPPTDGPDAAAPLRARRERLQQELCGARTQALQRIAAGELPPLEHQIVCLRYVRGETWDEVVRATGLTRRYVLARHTAALERVAAKEAAGGGAARSVKSGGRGAASS